MGSRRPLTPKTWFRPCFLGGGLALLLTLLPALAGPARADELVRHVQEELRKRNLYFGDVDGALSAPTAAALRRYQQRKGFPTTGQPDAVTLYSLMIPVPPVLASAPAASPTAAPAAPPPETLREAYSWPDVTVLRSDEGRRQPLTPVDLEAVLSTPGPAPTRPPRPPPAAASRQRPTAAEVRAFIARYLQAGQTNDPPAELTFFGSQVDYFNEGIVDQHFIGKDIDRYDRRWPERHFTILEPFTVASSPDGDPDKTVVTFRLQFLNRGSKYAARGKTDNTWTLAGENPADLRIIAIKEQRVRE